MMTADRKTASMIRVDQAGEYGATRIYAGQLAVMGDRHPMAREIARFPQAAVRADRRSVIETYGLPVRDAMRCEWINGVDAHFREGADGAARFSGGLGRHGDFTTI